MDTIEKIVDDLTISDMKRNHLTEGIKVRWNICTR